MPQNIQTITCRLPTFLKVLLQDDFNIKLIYRKEEKVKECSELLTEISEVCDEVSELDLTGTPLQTDLKGDDDVLIDIHPEIPTSWTLEESLYYPLTFKDARVLLNDQLKLKRATQFLYCICNGVNGEHIVGLGAIVAANKISRILVSVLPCCQENNERMSLAYMINDHSNNCNEKEKVNISITRNYDLYGYNLKNCEFLETLEYNGNVSMTTVTSGSNKLCSNMDMKMNLQVVVGHNNSPLFNFWEELCHIQSYIKLLEIPLNEYTVIKSDDFFDCSKINFLISDIVNTEGSCKKMACQSLDLNNLRPLSILDKLWNALKYCRTLSDLRDSLYFFFAEVAETHINVQMPSEDTSKVGEIAKGILKGEIAITTLTFVQSLELLIDLGLEKMKNDYLVIVGKEALMKKWSEFDEKLVTTSNKPAKRRTTRATVSDFTYNKMKFSFLESVHEAAEFIFLFKDNVQKVEGCADFFSESLCDQYIVKFPNVIHAYDLRQPRLCTFSFEVCSADGNVLIKNKSPVSFTVKLSSVLKFSEVVTVFHLSERPIFPPSIFADYEIPECDGEAKFYYMAKLVKYVQNC